MNVDSPMHLLRCLLLLWPASIAIAVAQQPPAVATAMRACGLARAEGDLIGLGPDYEFRFDASGVEYLPMLGNATPRPLPLRLAFDSARRGDAILAGGIATEASVEGGLVRYRRGGLVEQYELRPSGVEQSFVFAAKPAGSGDLVVRLRLATELPVAATDTGGLAFVQPGVGGVTFGAVTGVDASDERVAGRVRLVGDCIELSLPASFVEQASYPMVLDPLLGTAFAGPNQSNDDTSPDVAYDATTDSWLVVWTRGGSTAGQSIRAVPVGSTGTPGALLLVSGSGAAGVRLSPRVANVAQRDAFLVVWQESPSLFGPFDIVGASVSAVTGTISAIVQIAATAADETAPCISGDSTGSDDEAIVAWVDVQAGLVARGVTLPATGDPVPFTQASIKAAGVFVAVAAPCISKSGGAPGRHVIAWRETTGAHSEIHARAITRNLIPIGNELVVTANFVFNTDPAVDGDGSTFLIAWQQNGNIRGRRLDASASSLGLAGAEFSIAVGSAGRPDLAFLRPGRWCAVWEVVGPNFGGDVLGTILDPSGTKVGLGLTFPGLNRTATHDRETRPRVVGKFAGDSATTSDHGLVVFGESDVVPPFDGDVIGQGVEAIGPGGPVLTVAPGCGLGGSAGVSGPYALGNPDFAYTLTGADPSTSLAFLSRGFPGPAPNTCGPCSYVPGIAIDFIPMVGGQAIHPSSTPTDPAFLGLRLQVQWISFLGSSAPCPSLPGVAFSSRLEISLGQ